MSKKIIGIIAEYNPFHLGHAWQLEQAKSTCDADAVIVAMSGDYTQRGIPAILDKYTRARMALDHGADLVVEIPVIGATSSAETFARAGVGLLHLLGVVDTLAFGAEDANKEMFLHISDTLTNEAFSFKLALNNLLKEGHSYPKARAMALTTSMGNEDYATFLSHPNNILGIEYIKALQYFRSDMDFIPLKRQCQFASSTDIRGQIQLFDIEDIKDRVPSDSFDILKEAHSKNQTVFSNDFSLLLHRELFEKEDFSTYLDGSTDLSYRTIKLRDKFIETNDFAMNVLKSKNVTLSRIMRYLLHIMLNITNTDFNLFKSYGYAPYVRVLGINKDKEELLSEVVKNSALPVFTSFKEATNRLDSTKKMLFNKDLFATDLYNAVLTQKSGTVQINERSRGLVV